MQGCWLQDSSIGLTNGTACFLTPTSRPPRRASAPYQQKARIGLRSLPERGRAPLGCSQDTRRPQPSQTRGLPSPYSRGFQQRSRTPCSLVPLLCHFSRSLKPLPLPLQSTAATRLPCTTHKPIIQQVRKRILTVIYIYMCTFHSAPSCVFQWELEIVKRLLQHFQFRIPVLPPDLVSSGDFPYSLQRLKGEEENICLHLGC